jgi:hypothetical protein
MVHGRLDHTRINMGRDENQTDLDQDPRGDAMYLSQKQQEPWRKPWTLRRGIGWAIITCLAWGVSVLMLGIFIAERIFDAD